MGFYQEEIILNSLLLTLLSLTGTKLSHQFNPEHLFKDLIQS